MSNKFIFAFIFCCNLQFGNAQSAQGFIAIPEYNVLYRSYGNKLFVGATNGDTTLRLVSDKCQLERVGDYWIAKPKTGDRELTITIVNSSDEELGSYTYRLSNLPPPQLYLGTIRTGGKESLETIQTSTTLFARYPPEVVINGQFQIESWEMSIVGDNTETIKGNGPELSAEALERLKTVKSGTKVSFTAQYRGMDYAGKVAMEFEVI